MFVKKPLVVATTNKADIIKTGDFLKTHFNGCQKGIKIKQEKRNDERRRKYVWDNPGGAE